VIVDTTLLVDLLRGDPEAKAEVERLEATGAVLWIPTPVIFELAEGIERADRPPSERARVDAVLEGYTVLDFTRVHASRAGETSGNLIRRGSMIDPVDAQVAGIALVERLPVLTRNVKHFARVPGLETATY